MTEKSHSFCDLDVGDAVYVCDSLSAVESGVPSPEDALRASVEGTDELKQGQTIYVRLHKDDDTVTGIALAFHQKEGYAEVRVLAALPTEHGLFVTIDRLFRLL